MANYSANRAKHYTQSAGAEDKVAITGSFRRFELVHRSGSDPLYFRWKRDPASATDGPTAATVAGDDTDVLMPGTSKTLEAIPAKGAGGVTDAETVVFSTISASAVGVSIIGVDVYPGV